MTSRFSPSHGHVPSLSEIAELDDFEDMERLLMLARSLADHEVAKQTPLPDTKRESSDQ